MKNYDSQSHSLNSDRFDFRVFGHTAIVKGLKLDYTDTRYNEPNQIHYVDENIQ